MQATFGTTPNALRNLSVSITSDGSSADVAIATWVHEQMAMPLTSHREHYRRRVNPRLSPAQRTPSMMRQPACQPGSLWRRFAFTSQDEGRTLSVNALPGSLNGYRISIDGILRTEMRHAGAAANYTIAPDGDCMGLYAHITTLDECTHAAIALGEVWDAPWHSREFASSGATPGARDDGRGAPPLSGKNNGPPGCYLEGRPPRFLNDGSGGWVNDRRLYFNVNRTNTNKCKKWDYCICRRVPIVGAADAAGGSAGGESSAPPPATPPAAPPPHAPGVVANVTDPSECGASQCCVVLYKEARGRTCGALPIWDMSGWAHPGGGLVTASSMCGTVRYSWLSRSSSHGSCDASANCDPEADVWDKPLIGGSGAVRVGTYVDSAAECASNAYTICDVAEGLNGQIKLVHVGESCAGTANPDRFYIYNPPLALSSPSDYGGSTTHLAVDADDVALKAMPNAGFADMYTLERLDVPCELSAVSEETHLEVRPSSSSSSSSSGGNATAAASSASAWYALDRRVGFRGNTADAPCMGVNASDPTYDGPADACPSAVRSPMNAAGCTHSTSARAPAFASTLFRLNETTLRAYYERAGVLAYRVQGLRLESPYYAVSPCEPGVSRWWRVAPLPCADAAEAAGADTALDADTREAIEAAMAAGGDTNAFLRDIDVLAHLNARNYGTCHESLNGVLSMGAQLTVNGSCWV